MSEILTLTVHPRVVVNGRQGAGVPRSDIFVLPAVYAYSYINVKLVEVPLISGGVPFTIEEGTVAGETWEGSGIFYTQHVEETSPPLGTYKITDLGRVTGVFPIGFSSEAGGNAGRTIRVSYSGLGSQVSAEDINELSTGEMTAHSYAFNGDVMVPGTLTVHGDLEIEGEINKVITDVEELKIKDDRIILNSDGGSITSAGIIVNGTGLPGDPSIKWMAASSRWEVLGGLHVGDGLNIAATSIPAATIENVGKVYLDPSDDQFKGIISNGGVPKVVVLG